MPHSGGRVEQGTRLNSSKAIYIIGSRTFGDMAGHPARAGMSQKLTDDSAVKISNSHSWGLFYTKTKTSYITYRVFFLNWASTENVF